MNMPGSGAWSALRWRLHLHLWATHSTESLLLRHSTVRSSLGRVVVVVLQRLPGCGLMMVWMVLWSQGSTVPISPEIGG